jgi:hypothetical protein
MLCCLTLDRMARWPMIAVRGVSVLELLGLVKIWYSEKHGLIFLSVPWWRPQSGQSSSEYGLIVGFGVGVAWASWYILGLTVTELHRVVLHVLFSGWADWMVSGLL